MRLPPVFALPDGAQMRPVKRADAAPLAAAIAANLEHLQPWMPWSHGYDPVSTEVYIAAAERQVEDKQGAQFIVSREGRAAGTIGFHAINWANRSTSIGYWLSTETQGRGIASAAVRGLTAHAFREWGLHRIELRAAPDNVRSRAVAERCGFREEGVAREAELIGGRFRDLVVYSLLA